MPPDDQTPSHPMLQVFKSIGEIKTGIDHLQKGQHELTESQGEVNEKISGLHRTVADLVTIEDCEARHAALADQLAGEEDDAPTSDFPPPSTGMLARAGKNAGNITKILTLVASLVIGLWAVHKFVVRVESALDRNAVQATKATKAITKRLDKPRPPQVVYVPVTVHPDAGPRRRRRPRRRVVRPASKRATHDTR